MSFIWASSTSTYSDPLYSTGNQRPTLDLQFARGKSLNDYASGQNLVTFTRDSIGTYVDENGVIQTATANTPRFDHDPETGESLGLLIEESRTNSILNSGNWSLFATTKANMATNATTTTAPDGATSVNQIEASATTFASSYQIVSLTASTTYTISAFFKAGNFSLAKLQIWDVNGYFVTGTFNLSTGTASPGAVIQELPDGWYRCSVTGVATNTTSLGRAYFEFDNPVSVGSTLYIWGAQLEQGSFPTSYIPTSGSTVTRSTDLVSILGSNYTSIFGTTLGSGSIFADVKVLGENNNTLLGSFAGFGTSNNDIFTFLLSYDNRTNVGFALPSDANVSKYNDLTGQRAKGAVSWTNLEVSVSDQTNASNALDGDLYGGSQYSNVGSSLNSQYDRFGIGRAIRSTTTYYSINGHISRLTYYPVRLPDATLQTITS